MSIYIYRSISYLIILQYMSICACSATMHDTLIQIYINSSLHCRQATCKMFQTSAERSSQKPICVV